MNNPATITPDAVRAIQRLWLGALVHIPVSVTVRLLMHPWCQVIARFA
jgi:hypothetical protein